MTNRIDDDWEFTNEKNVYAQWLAWAMRQDPLPHNLDELAVRMRRSPAASAYHMMMLIRPELDLPDIPEKLHAHLRLAVDDHHERN